MLRKTLWFIRFILFFSTAVFPTAAEDFTNAIRAFLEHRVEVEKICVGMVVGLVDEQGSRVVSYGKLDNGTGQDVNGDTVFMLCSVTKVFTGLLLQDMIDRGEMKLDDPVAKYLPQSVRMPTRNGKEITLRQLATHSSGLPKWPDDLNPQRADHPYDDYAAEKFYTDLPGWRWLGPRHLGPGQNPSPRSDKLKIPNLPSGRNRRGDPGRGGRVCPRQ
jgi:CubicO group peptidase (beta-lactamase class C family)